MSARDEIAKSLISGGSKRTAKTFRNAEKKLLRGYEWAARQGVTKPTGQYNAKKTPLGLAERLSDAREYLGYRRVRNRSGGQ